jgi:head-tail adaptor
MPPKRGAGQLQEMVAFAKRAAVDDGYGNTISGDFADQFQQAASFVYLRGSDEGVEAGGIASQLQLILRIRNSEQARLITAAWQARDTRKGTVFNIKTVTTDPSREFLELLCESGIAPG